MLAHVRPALVLLVLFSALTGLVYPLAITGIAGAVFPAQANGSLIVRDGKVIGSSLIGQNFTEAKYFHGRPSATSDTDPNDPTKTVSVPYNAAASSGANKGPTSKDLIERVQGDIAALKDEAHGRPIPIDAVTTSGSGLDPHITPAYAEFQIARVAAARKLDEAQLRALVARHTEGRQLGVLGEPRVNVLQLNLALDRLTADKAS
jgi:potassium-transporting ATPase KdpC subunit